MAKDKKAEPREVEAENKMYELMLVLKPDLLESAVTKKLKEFSKFLKDGECDVKLEDVWGKRTLAYRIKQFDEGIYVVYNIIAPTTFIKEIDNHLRIDNEVIRHLLISIENDYKYSKFDEEVEEPKEEKKTPKKEISKKEKSVKEVVKEEPVEEPVEEKEVKEEEVVKEKEEVVEEPVEEKEVKEEEVVKEKEEEKEKEEIDRSALDSKLDDLLSGDDLNI